MMIDVIREVNALFVMFDIDSRAKETEREGYLFAIHSRYEHNGHFYLDSRPSWLFRDADRLREIANLIIKEQLLDDRVG